jgi:predicted nucleotidyltransferase
MARNTFENDLQSSIVNIKKYFYTLRSALAGLWIVENKRVPPVQFGDLRTIIKDEQWQLIIDGLLESKKSSNEKTLISTNTFLQHWISKALSEVKEKSVALPAVKNTPEFLDIMFQKFIHHNDL